MLLKLPASCCNTYSNFSERFQCLVRCQCQNPCGLIGLDSELLLCSDRLLINDWELLRGLILLRANQEIWERTNSFCACRLQVYFAVYLHFTPLNPLNYFPFNLRKLQREVKFHYRREALIIITEEAAVRFWIPSKYFFIVLCVVWLVLMLCPASTTTSWFQYM